MGSLAGAASSARSVAVLVAVLSLGSVARAAVDLNGPWRVVAETEPYFNPDVTCIVDVVQTGGAITIDGGSCAIAFQLTGTVDTVTGAVVASGASDPLLCPTMSITATATPASDSFAGTFDCNGILPVSGPFLGGLCANGVVNAGESCDDGNLNTNDCCSATCGFEPAGYQCFADGTVCTTDRCDGAGVCVPVDGPAGRRCESDGNSCTDDTCDSSGTCNHVNRPAGSECFADFNVCTDDVCDAGGACQAVNNTVPCDDWNSCTVGDTCAAGSCVPGGQFAPSGTACNVDGSSCTVDACDGVGGCQNQGCSLCCGGIGCSPKLGNCVAPVAPAAKLQFSHYDADESRDKLLFNWKAGGATTLSDFGNPLASTSYEMCIFDTGEPRPVLRVQAGVPPGGTCAGKPCWKSVGSAGYAYKDKGLLLSGIERLRFKSGGDGEARIIVGGRGSNLGLERAYYYDAPLRVEVRASNGKCWSATFDELRYPGWKLQGKGGQ